MRRKIAFYYYMGAFSSFRIRPCSGHFLAALVLAATVAAPVTMRAQDATAAKPAAYNKVIGEVVSIDASGKKMTVKPDAGASSDVIIDDATSFMRVPPGEKDLRKASRIELKDIGVGDRVYARSRKIEGQDSSPAVSIILMSKTELAQHQEKSREEWTKRGSAGKVVSVDAAAKTITVTMQAAGGPKPITIETDDKTNFRRYAPDSVKFADAQPSKLADIAAGNNVRVLGDKSEDGTKIHAEDIVSGSFRNIAGTVTAIDPAANEIKLTDLASKKVVTIKVNEDSNLRKLPPEMAAIVARMAARAAGNTGAPGAAGAPAGAAGQPKGQGGPDSKPGFNGPANPQGGAPGQMAAGGAPGNGMPGAGPGGPGAGGPGGRGRMDMAHMLEQAPQFTLKDLKPGDALVITSTNGSDPSRVTAISIVAGVEPILAAAPPGRSGAGAGAGGGAGGGGGFGGGMPAGMDMGFPQ